MCTRTILKPFSFHSPHKLKRNEKDDDEEQSFISHEKIQLKRTAIYVCTRTILKPFTFHTPHKLKRNENDADDDEQSFISHEKNLIKNYRVILFLFDT